MEGIKKLSMEMQAEEAEKWPDSDTDSGECGKFVRRCNAGCRTGIRAGHWATKRENAYKRYRTHKSIIDGMPDEEILQNDAPEYIFNSDAFPADDQAAGS